MSADMIVTIDDVRAAGLCVNGRRVLFARHDLGVRVVLREGCTAETLRATGDAMALRVVERARIRLEVH